MKKTKLLEDVQGIILNDSKFNDFKLENLRNRLMNYCHSDDTEELENEYNSLKYILDILVENISSKEDLVKLQKYHKNNHISW